MIEEDARIKIAAQIDLADQAVLARVGHKTATAGVAVLPAALRAQAGLGEHVLRRNAQHDGHQGEHVLETCAGLLGVDGFGRRVFGHMGVQLALGLGRPLVQIDGAGVLRHIGIVEAIAGHPLARRPFAPLAGHLAQTARELGRRRVVHLDGNVGTTGRVGHRDNRGAPGRPIEHLDCRL